MLRKVFEEAMVKIEDCLRYYDKAGDQLWKQLKKEPFGFRYDPNEELEQINADLRVAIAAYHRMTGNNGDYAAKTITEMQEGTKKANELLKQLASVAADSAFKIKQVFEEAATATRRLALICSNSSLGSY